MKNERLRDIDELWNYLRMELSVFKELFSVVEHLGPQNLGKSWAKSK